MFRSVGTPEKNGIDTHPWMVTSHPQLDFANSAFLHSVGANWHGLDHVSTCWGWGAILIITFISDVVTFPASASAVLYLLPTY